MATYVILMNWTDQGIRADRESVRRRDQADALAEKHGARIAHVYWTMGQHDIMAVIEAPDDESITAMMLELTAAATSGRPRFAASITRRCRQSSKEPSEITTTGPGRATSAPTLTHTLVTNCARPIRRASLSLYGRDYEVSRVVASLLCT
jgi:uncharacterized protein with GYD domain